MAQDRPEIARIAAVHRTIPKDYEDIAVTGNNGTTDLGAKYGGKFVFLKALTADVTILRNKAVSAAGAGFVVGVNDVVMQEFFVDPTDTNVLNHRAGGACVLRIFFD